MRHHAQQYLWNGRIKEKGKGKREIRPFQKKHTIIKLSLDVGEEGRNALRGANVQVLARTNGLTSFPSPDVKGYGRK